MVHTQFKVNIAKDPQVDRFDAGSIIIGVNQKFEVSV